VVELIQIPLSLKISRRTSIICPFSKSTSILSNLLGGLFVTERVRERVGLRLSLLSKSDSAEEKESDSELESGRDDANAFLAEYAAPTSFVKIFIFESFKVSFANFYLYRHPVFGWQSLVINFLATQGQRLAGGWSRQGSNPVTSDSQPVAMTTKNCERLLDKFPDCLQQYITA